MPFFRNSDQLRPTWAPSGPYRRSCCFERQAPLRMPISRDSDQLRPTWAPSGPYRRSCCLVLQQRQHSAAAVAVDELRSSSQHPREAAVSMSGSSARNVRALPGSTPDSSSAQSRALVEQRVFRKVTIIFWPQRDRLGPVGAFFSTRGAPCGLRPAPQSNTLAQAASQ